MDKNIFGIYNIPSTSDDLTASYTTTNEFAYTNGKEDFYENREGCENNFDRLLTGVVAVPKPTKPSSKTNK